MKTFNVEFAQTITVNAETEDEAIEKAKIQMDPTTFCAYPEEIEYCPEYDDEKIYKVEAISTQRYKIYIKAKNEDEAMELAEQADGSKFIPVTTYNGWEMMKPELLTKTIGNKYDKLYNYVSKWEDENECPFYMNGAWFNTNGNGWIDMETPNGAVLTNDIEEIDGLLNESGLELVFEGDEPIVKDITKEDEL